MDATKALLGAQVACSGALQKHEQLNFNCTGMDAGAHLTRLSADCLLLTTEAGLQCVTCSLEQCVTVVATQPRAAITDCATSMCLIQPSRSQSKAQGFSPSLLSHQRLFLSCRARW